ncbi:hypothetical protein [Devosia aurantiaca]|uniref:Uncharacterized protein n=1 Tax=Devosia aurantiaca TaxID=2714858 RepID=A0A6M1SYD6_9HYPH|nr:hypothetical protein [Devosia aurantiaca]NGP19313.1 hypothetical protein [Devosia aurantiaca]
MARAGRKRKIGVLREKNGKPSRAGKRITTEQENMRAAVEYRQSVFGLSPKDAMDQKASTVHGRLCLQGAISQAQWQAAENWLDIVNAMSAALQSPRGFKTAGSCTPMTISEELEAAKYQAIKDAYDKANDAIEDHAPVEECKARLIAMRTIVIEGVDQPSMHGTLRTALNGLAKHFGLESRSKAA